MKQTLNTSIEKINHLGRKSLEEHLVSEQTLPNSDEKVFNIGYALLKLDRLDEAYEDYNEDMENGIFNLLQNIMKEDDSDNKLNAHKKIAMINKILILKMEKSFHEITWNKYKEILYNIVSLGCTNTYFKILHEKYPEIESIIKTTF